MKILKKPVEFFVMIEDPARPDRGAAWHVAIAELLDRENGTPLQELSRSTLNIAEARAAGFDIPKIAAGFNADEASANVELRKEKENLDRENKDNATLAAAQTARAETAETQLVSITRALDAAGIVLTAETKATSAPEA